VPQKFYNLSRTEAFYQHKSDEVALIPVFAAFVLPDAAVQLSAEHDRGSGCASATSRSGLHGRESEERWRTFCQ